MDHEATREQLELAAVDPSGLDRLMAGDTPIAQAVAGHLAGCPGCSDELARLERTCRLVREVARAMPPADLRDRTFAAVRALKHLLERDGNGLVVNISSIAAKLAIGSNIMYCASKVAVDTLTSRWRWRSLRRFAWFPCHPAWWRRKPRRSSTGPGSTTTSAERH